MLITFRLYTITVSTHNILNSYEFFRFTRDLGGVIVPTESGIYSWELTILIVRDKNKKKVCVLCIPFLFVKYFKEFKKLEKKNKRKEN